MKHWPKLLAAILLPTMLLFLLSCAHGQEREVVHREFMYVSVPVEQQMELCDIIVAGTVTSISRTRWNQDSGEYWERVVKLSGDDQYVERALPIYTVEILVDEPVVAAQKGEKLTVTVIGDSPLDEPRGGAEWAAYRLRKGSKVVAFIRRTEIVWRDGTRSVLEPLTHPEGWYYLRAEDGLYQTLMASEQSQPEPRVSLEELLSRIRRGRAAN